MPTPDEAALYCALGLAEIPPELREGGDEMPAPPGSLPALLEESDLAGFLHCQQLLRRHARNRGARYRVPGGAPAGSVSSGSVEGWSWPGSVT